MSKPKRNLWPISIVVFFAIAIAFSICFVTWVVRLRDDLVSPDYYEREVRYQTQLDSMNRSLSVASKTVVTFEPAQQAIIITLPEASNAATKGSIHLYRPSDARLDRELPLQLTSNGTQRLDASKLADGLWKVRVKWTVDGKDFFLDQPVIVTSS